MSANLLTASRPAPPYKLSTLKVAAILPWLVAALSLIVLSFRVQAQAPGLLWTTNIGARVFALDSQTNVYANVGGTVIQLSATGVPLQTNAICPIPGLAQRDSSGNYYYAGSVIEGHASQANR